MTPEELKALTCALQELTVSSKETATAIRGFSDELHCAQRLWRKSGSSRLIQIGLALIAFPDPTISDVIGCALVAAGLVQLKMKNSALHLEDVYKTFPQVMKELTTTKLRAP
jgi:hypothetical protein